MDSEVRSMSDLADLLDPPGLRDPTHPHVTGLIRGLDDIGRTPRPFNYDALPQSTKNIMAMGRIWEYLVRPDITREAVRVGLIPVWKLTPEVDGIIGSLDCALFRPPWTPDGPQKAEVVVEIKARFSARSAPRNKDFPQSERKYIRQCKSYCYMTGARKVWMPILYFGSSPPNMEYVIHRFEFSDLEVEENWRMLLNMKGYLPT